MKIGFIGLGIMGSRMAANLQKKGYELVLSNRTKTRANALIENGAVWANSPAEAAGQVELLFTMLSTPQVVEATATGDKGFLASMAKDTLWVDCSTVNTSFSRRMAAAAHQAGIRFVDAPVAGSKIPAENAQLIFLVGGKDEDVQEIRPILDTMGRQVIHGGGNGSGTALKMVYNLLLGESMLAFSEALMLGQSLGLSRDLLFEALTGSIVVAPFATAKRPKIEAGHYEADFPLQWMEKDLQLASQSAYEQGLALPAVNAAKEIYRLAIRHGFAEKDFSAIYEFLNEKFGGKENKSFD